MASVRASARRYAQALFQIAHHRQTYDAWLRGLESLEGLMGDPQAQQVLTSPAVPEDERLAAVDQLLPDLEREVRNFVRLLVQRGRLELAPEISTALRERIDEARGVAVARVTSAVDLDEEMRNLVAQRLSVQTGKQVRLEVSVDPEIIGGIVARVGDELIDASVRGRLARLRDTLAQPVGSKGEGTLEVGG